MRSSCFDRETSNALKGIALILMFVHHFFTFPDWIVCGVEYPWQQAFTNQFCAPTDICVRLFAFLTGYFYAFSKGTLGYSARKITDFLLSYWTVCLPLILIAMLTGSFTLSKSGLMMELLGLKNGVMTFCWYVYFYCIVMVMLPLLTRRDSHSPIMDTFVLLVLPTVWLNIWVDHETQWTLHAVAWNLRQWYPCVAVGYLFGKYGLFEKWFDAFLPKGEKPGFGVRVVLPAIMVWAAFRGRYYIEGLNLGSITFRSSDITMMLTEDIVNAPLFLYGAASLLLLCRKSLFFRVLEKIGKRSMLMWFYHCIFFNCCKQFTQIILYFPRNPILVLLNGLLLCYLAAAVTEPVRKALVDGKNRLLDWAAGKQFRKTTS